jgi:hypothetical protein
VLQGVFVPYSVRVEHEDFLGLDVSEDHVWVEYVDAPEKLAWHNLSLYFLQVLDINIYSSELSKVASFVEDHLLSVRQ